MRLLDYKNLLRRRTLHLKLPLKPELEILLVLKIGSLKESNKKLTVVKRELLKYKVTWMKK